MIEVYEHGTKVEFAGKNIGIITAAIIRGEYVTYEVSYADNGSHTHTELHPVEFKVVNGKEKKQIGFKKGGED